MSARTITEWRPDPLLTIDDVATWLGKPKNTLYAWHSRGKGPRAIRVGNTLRYRRSEVERWLDIPWAWVIKRRVQDLSGGVPRRCSRRSGCRF
jgi:excisionase family DNA binding protein